MAGEGAGTRTGNIAHAVLVHALVLKSRRYVGRSAWRKQEHYEEQRREELASLHLKETEKTGSWSAGLRRIFNLY